MKTQRKPRPQFYQVNHARTSGGPKFSSITEALRFIAYAMRNGNDYMSISRIRGAK